MSHAARHAALPEILRLAAFTTDPQGGNPAGVLLDAADLDASDMLSLAAEVGFSETAFVTSSGEVGGVPNLEVRYFSPATEVDFCGHATVATAVAWAQRHGPGELLFKTRAGGIAITTERDGQGLRAALTSVPTSVREVPDDALTEALAALRWSPSELDPELPPRIAFGGVDHLVLAAADRRRLAALDYDFERLRHLMEAEGWITVQLVHREGRDLFHSRNPFPVGGVVEDPATGAAAAALGGYLRDLGILPVGEQFLIRQGEDMGQPSRLQVEILADGERIRVSGHACAMVG